MSEYIQFHPEKEVIYFTYNLSCRRCGEDFGEFKNDQLREMGETIYEHEQVCGTLSVKVTPIKHEP